MLSENSHSSVWGYEEEKGSREENEVVERGSEMCSEKEKVMYKRLLDAGTVEAKQMYNKAKLVAKNAVRRAKNEEWVKLGRELEKDASSNQQRFWAKVNGSRRT